MRVELFYFDGCPNVEPTYNAVSEALDSLGLKADIVRVIVVDNDDAMSKQFLGSPSVRFDGMDLEVTDETDEEYSMRCRRYLDGERMVGCPPRALILSALHRAIVADGSRR